MAITTVRTVVCDCCGYSAAADAHEFVTVEISTQITSASSTIPARVSYALCTVHGCGAGLTTTLGTTISAASVTHQAGIVAGVIPAH